jgi:hypothetical protein
MLQGFLQSRLMSRFCRFYGRYNDLIYDYKLTLNHMLSDTFRINSYAVLSTMPLTADNSAFLIIQLGSRRVWPVDRGCLLLLGTWSHLWYIRGSLFAHLFLWLVIIACDWRLITLWYSSHFINTQREIFKSPYMSAKSLNRLTWYLLIKKWPPLSDA